MIKGRENTDNLSKELERLSLELGIVEKVECSPEERKRFRKAQKADKQLPDDVGWDGYDFFYRRVRTGLSDEEIERLFRYRQVSYLRTIKNCGIILVLLAVIFIILNLLL